MKELSNPDGELFTKRQVLDAISELRSLHQGIGSMNARLRKCKFNTKKYNEYSHTVDEFHFKSNTLMDKIHLSFQVGFRTEE